MPEDTSATPPLRRVAPPFSRSCDWRDVGRLAPLTLKAGQNVDFGLRLLPGAWKRLEPRTALPIVAKIMQARAAEGLEPLTREFDVVWLRALPLAFYSRVLLLELGLSGERRDASYDLLYSEHGIMPLDGSAAVIHGMNARTQLDLSDRERARDYVRFFCSVTRGEEGRFLLVSRSSETREAIVGSGPERLREAEQKTRALRLARKASGEWSASGTMLYDHGLHKVRLAVGLDGMVQMLDDETVMTGLPDVAERCEGPLRTYPEAEEKREGSRGE